MTCEIMYNNFEISFVVFMPNITTNHSITYTNFFPVVSLMMNFSGQLHLGEKNSPFTQVKRLSF